MLSPIGSEDLSCKEMLDVAKRLSLKFFEQAGAYDENDEFPDEHIDNIVANRLHAVPLEKEFGGNNAGFLTISRLLAQFAKGCPSTALCLAMHYFTIAALNHKLPAGIRKIVLRDVWENGEFFSSFNLANVTPFHPNFDYGESVSLKIERVHGGYLINGIKKTVTAAGRFKYIPVIGKQDGIKKSFYGLTALLLQKNDPGVSVQESWRLSGMRATMSHDIHFKDVWVPEERLIGREGFGLEDTSDEYYWSRLAISSVYLGIAEAAVDHLSDVIRKKKDGISKKPVSYMPGAQYAFADLKIKLETARSQLTMYALQADEESNCSSKFSNDLYQKALVTKYYLTNTVNEIVWEAMQIEGIQSFNRGSLLERLYRDARAATFHYPSNDLLKEMLAKTSLGVLAIHGRWA